MPQGKPRGPLKWNGKLCRLVYIHVLFYYRNISWYNLDKKISLGSSTILKKFREFYDQAFAKFCLIPYIYPIYLDTLKPANFISFRKYIPSVFSWASKTNTSNVSKLDCQLESLPFPLLKTNHHLGTWVLSYNQK